MLEQAIKDKVKETFSKIALTRNSSEGCCAPTECCGVSGDISMDSTSNRKKYWLQ
jgi:hypothetical protein